MANQNVVDELVVKLTLDTAEYDKRDAVIDKRVDATERKEKKQDTERTRRGKKRKQQAVEEKRDEQDRIKRMKETQAAAKQLGGTLRSLALTLGAVLGVSGGATGLVGAVLSLANFETGLRRAAVSTGMSNRELQAWGSTAKRLGADADAGAQAIAELAREQKQFNLTGSGPTMMALARMGVRVSPNANIGEMLGQAQQIYRGANPAQQQQIEAALSAQGVSNDLIVMIKSEQDAREAYTRSIGESTTENKKTLSALNDALASAGNAALAFANSVAQDATPYIKDFADWLDRAASDTSGFDSAIHTVGKGLDILGQLIDVVLFGFNELALAGERIVGWFDRLLGRKGDAHPVADAIKTVGAAVKWAWTDMVSQARREGPNFVGGLTGDEGGAQLSASARARLNGNGAPSGSTSDEKMLMQQLIVGYGLSVPQAAAVVTNWQAESGLRANAFNDKGGGLGAMGLAQLRGDRAIAFKKRFGVAPNQASVSQQIEFAMTDPHERHLLDMAFAQGGDLGAAVSRIYEAHGSVAEDLRRGAAANALAASYGDTNTSSTQQVNINGPVTVQANSPQEFVGGIQRLPGVQNYNGAVR